MSPLYRLNRGPRYGQLVNLPQSQEVHLADLLGDIVPEGGGTQPQPQQKANSIPPRGWTIARVGWELKTMLVWNDGVGGSYKFLDVPNNVRNIPNPPAELVERFKTMRGPDANAQAEANERQRREAERAAEQAKHPGMRIL